MIENLETLLTLARIGTMMEASTELRITQSAVSKRISTLERYYKRKLIQKKGRRVELTQHGQHLVDKISPVLSELRDLFIDEVASGKGELVIGVSDAILSSWGLKCFTRLEPICPKRASCSILIGHQLCLTGFVLGNSWLAFVRGPTRWIPIFNLKSLPWSRWSLSLLV